MAEASLKCSYCRYFFGLRNMSSAGQNRMVAAGASIAMGAAWGREQFSHSMLPVFEVSWVHFHSM